MQILKSLRLDTPVATSAAGSVGLRVIAPGLNLALSIVLVRIAGTREFGVYAYCLAIVTLLLLPITSGLMTSVVRHVAAYHARGEWALLRGTLHRSGQVVLATSLALVGVGALIGAASVKIAPESAGTFGVALILIPVVALSAFRSATLRGLHHVVWGQLPEQIVTPAAMLTLMAIVAATGMRVGARTLVSLQVIAAAIALLVGSILLRRRMPTEIADVVPRYEDRYWLQGALPLMLLGGFQRLNQEFGVIVVGQIDGAAAAGVLRIAGRAAELVSFVLSAFSLAIAPSFSRLHALNDAAELSRLAGRATRVAFLMSLPIAVPLILAGGPILRLLYGPELVVGATALAILSLGQLVNVTSGPVGSLLTMTGHERDSARGVLLTLPVSVTLTALLAWRWGISGAAIGLAVGLAFKNVVLCWLVFKRLHLRPAVLVGRS